MVNNEGAFPKMRYAEKGGLFKNERRGQAVCWLLMFLMGFRTLFPEEVTAGFSRGWAERVGGRGGALIRGASLDFSHFEMVEISTFTKIYLHL